ncbi:MAG: S41 family peptidase [bacterium]
MNKKNLLLLLSLVFVIPTLLFSQNKQSSKGDADRQSDAMRSIEIYNAVLRELEINYVDTFNYDRLLELSLGRMLYSLDPYVTYVPESDPEFVKLINSGQYGGIGSVITLVDDEPYLSEPYFGSPAQANGLRAGDKILEIDGKKCKDMALSKVSETLRGTPNTNIKLKVQRVGVDKPIVKTFMRKLINTETVPYYGTVAPKVGYVVINDFIDRTSTDFEDAVAALVKSNSIESLIVDLRGNGGGLVTQAVDIASLFVPARTKIVEMRGRHKEDTRVYETYNEPLYPDMKLIFLVDENSASSSEILAGGLQDLDRAVIVGNRTFGKGLVQTLRQLPYNAFLKVTTAKYYLPSGRCIQAIDYADNNSGQNSELPDSLINEYYTKNNRVVYDGSGIMPDSIVEESNNYNISAYLYMKSIYFKYANEFVAKNPTIDAPDVFVFTDEQYNDFCSYVLSSGFTYRLNSEQYLQQLKEMVGIEGYDDITQQLFEQLTDKLQPNIEGDLIKFRADITPLLESEIIKRYYYHKGVFEYNSREDEYIKTALDIINSGEYNEII